jgi:flagellar biosynthesis activator protein FlaF
MTPYDAYVNTANMSMSDRQVEAEALSKAALLLLMCQQNWDAPDRDRRLMEALDFNQKLWSIFQTSLSDPDHPLSPDLRRDILRLGGFIDKRIFEVQAYPAPEKLHVIIQINQNLAAGLRMGAGNAENRAPVEAEARSLREEAVWA